MSVDKFNMRTLRFDTNMNAFEHEAAFPLEIVCVGVDSDTLKDWFAEHHPKAEADFMTVQLGRGETTVTYVWLDDERTAMMCKLAWGNK